MEESGREGSTSSDAALNRSQETMSIGNIVETVPPTISGNITRSDTEDATGSDASGEATQPRDGRPRKLTLTTTGINQNFSKAAEIYRFPPDDYQAQQLPDPDIAIDGAEGGLLNERLNPVGVNEEEPRASVREYKAFYDSPSPSPVPTTPRSAAASVLFSPVSPQPRGRSQAPGHRRGQSSTDFQGFAPLSANKDLSPGIKTPSRSPRPIYRNMDLSDAERIQLDALKKDQVSREREQHSIRLVQKRLLRFVAGGQKKHSRRRRKQMEMLMSEEYSSDEGDEPTNFLTLASVKQQAGEGESRPQGVEAEEISVEELSYICEELLTEFNIVVDRHVQIAQRAVRHQTLTEIEECLMYAWFAKMRAFNTRAAEDYRAMLLYADKAAGYASRIDNEPVLARCRYWQGLAEYALHNWSSAGQAFNDSVPAVGFYLQKEHLDFALDATAKSQKDGREVEDVRYFGHKVRLGTYTSDDQNRSDMTHEAILVNMRKIPKSKLDPEKFTTGPAELDAVTKHPVIQGKINKMQGEAVFGAGNTRSDSILKSHPSLAREKFGKVRIDSLSGSAAIRRARTETIDSTMSGSSLRNVTDLGAELEDNDSDESVNEGV